MEREPVAQMDNGQPYVAPFLDSPSVNAMGGGIISPFAAQVATMFTTITSVEIATIFYTSLLISTSITIETSYINMIAPSQVSGFSNIGLFPSPLSSSSASPTENKNMSSALTFPSLSESTSLSSSTSGSLPLSFPSSSTSITNMATSLPLSPTATAISRHESLTKLMIGLVAGIFVAAALLTSLLVFLRKRSNRVSEVEAANVQRQQQPLISEPVPYSSAYGSSGQK